MVVGLRQDALSVRPYRLRNFPTHVVDVGGGEGTDHDRLGVAAQRVLEHARELRVAVRHHHLRSFHKKQHPAKKHPPPRTLQ